MFTFVKSCSSEDLSSDKRVSRRVESWNKGEEEEK